MFYIQGSTGRTFEGTLEALWRVEKASRPQPERSLAQQDAVATRAADHDAAESSQEYSVSSNNAQQYAAMLEQQGNREAVFHAYQVMTQSMVLIDATWMVSQAAAQFRNFPFQVFPIVDDARQLVGTLSRQQFYEFLLREGAHSEIESATVADCFLNNRSGVYCSDPVTDIRRIATLLVEKKLDAVPIVEQSGLLVGIVSRTDILKCTVSDPPLSLWC